MGPRIIDGVMMAAQRTGRLSQSACVGTRLHHSPAGTLQSHLTVPQFSYQSISPALGGVNDLILDNAYPEEIGDVRKSLFKSPLKGEIWALPPKAVFCSAPGCYSSPANF